LEIKRNTSIFTVRGGREKLGWKDSLKIRKRKCFEGWLALKKE